MMTTPAATARGPGAEAFRSGEGGEPVRARAHGGSTERQLRDRVRNMGAPRTSGAVLVDGVPTYSCHTLATEAVGKRIFTVEGLGDEKNLHPLQQVWSEQGVPQCGYCQSGMIMAVSATISSSGRPTKRAGYREPSISPVTT